MFGTAGLGDALHNSSLYPGDFAPYVPAQYRVERTSPLKLAITAYAAHYDQQAERGDTVERGGEVKVKCSYPLDPSQLTQGNFPKVDWANLTESLWAPWCGFKVANCNTNGTPPPGISIKNAESQREYRITLDK